MKKLIILITFMIFYSYANGEVYYCSEKLSVGFGIKENEQMSFTLDRFKLKLDLQKPMIESSEIKINRGDGMCKYGVYGKTIYCISSIGSAIAFDTVSNKFVLAIIFLKPDLKDTNNIAWGTCEKF